MRIATHNINDVRKRIGPLSAWLDVTSPDVVCLQELKCTEAEFPRALWASDHAPAWVELRA